MDVVQGEKAAMRLALYWAANPNNNNEIRPQQRELRSLLFAKGVLVL